MEIALQNVFKLENVFFATNICTEIPPTNASASSFHTNKQIKRETHAGKNINSLSEVRIETLSRITHQLSAQGTL